LSGIDPDALNPRQALEALYRLRALLDGDGAHAGRAEPPA
jgi:hypothetical protein